MDRNEMEAILQSIGTCEDEAERRTMLATLTTEVGTMFDNVNNLTEENDRLTAANESLRSANMDLFLQIGTKGKDDPEPGGEPGDDKKLTYEALFNEKGELI